MVSSVSTSQLGQIGDAAWQIWWRYFLSAIWPVRSWMSIEACLQLSSWTRFNQILEGVDLSRWLMHWYQGDVFQCLFHLCWILACASCCNAEMPNGMGLHRNAERSLVGLDSPSAACLVASLAFLLGLKLVWPGTQCICISQTPLVLTGKCWSLCLACWTADLHWSQSCLAWRCSAAVWIWSRR